MGLGNEDRIRRQAYGLWEKEGSPLGRDLEFWERARLMVEAEAKVAVSTPLQERSAADRKADAASEGTFPASDPPSFTVSTGARVDSADG